MKRQPHANIPGNIPSARHVLSSVFSSSPTHTRHTDPEDACNSDMIYEFTMAYARRFTLREEWNLRLSRKPAL
jgi:hypothetical protein